MKPTSSPAAGTLPGILLATRAALMFTPPGARSVMNATDVSVTPEARLAQLLVPLRDGAESGLPPLFVAIRRMRAALSRVLVVIDDADRTVLQTWIERAGGEMVVSRHSLLSDALMALQTLPEATPAAGAASQGWLLGYAHMPAIAPATIQAIAAMLNSPDAIVQPHYDGVPGFPLAMGAGWREACTALPDPAALQSWTDAKAPVAQIVKTGDAGVITVL